VVDTRALAEAVVDLSPTLKQQIIRPMETCGQTRMAPNQLAILTILKDGPRTMASLGKNIWVCRQQMTGLIEELVKKELVTRAPGKKDKRTVEVTLTEQGLQAVRQWEEEMIRALMPVFEQYTERQKAQLMKTARTMHEIMQG